MLFRNAKTRCRLAPTVSIRHFWQTSIAPRNCLLGFSIRSAAEFSHNLLTDKDFPFAQERFFLSRESGAARV